MSTDLTTLPNLDLGTADANAADGADDELDITYELELGPGWRALAWLGTCMGYATYVVDLPLELTRWSTRRATRRGQS